jgi:hypothetical protein
MSIQVDIAADGAETFTVEAGPARLGAAKTDSWVLKVVDFDELKVARERFADIVARDLAGKANP